MEGALRTPRPSGPSILRTPHTPGTGSSVRFGTREYEDGEESMLSASHSSVAPSQQGDQSTSMQLEDVSSIETQRIEMGNESVNSELSFSESFLKREVGVALEGLRQSVSAPADVLPQTPGRGHEASAQMQSQGADDESAPNTVRAPRIAAAPQVDSPESSPRRPMRAVSTSPATSPAKPAFAAPSVPEEHEKPSEPESTTPLTSPSKTLRSSQRESTSPLSSPTVRGQASADDSASATVRVPVQEGAVEADAHAGGDAVVEAAEPVVADKTEGPAEAPVGAPVEELDKAPANVPEAENSTVAEPVENAPARDAISRYPAETPTETETTEHAAEPLAADTSEDALPRPPHNVLRLSRSSSQSPASQLPIPAAHTPKTPSGLSTSLRRSRATPGSSSFSSSLASWATPRTEASATQSPSSRRSPSSPGNWPGMHELSYLSDKEELDEDDAGALVPFAVEELSSKLFAIDRLGNVDARELFEMVAQLDRTHTERTIFLQHRLARAHRLNQVLRASLAQSQEKTRTFEAHVHDLMEHKADSTTHAHAELQRLSEELEERLRVLPSHGPLAIAPADPLEAERHALDEERAQLAMERRDLEIRLASMPSTDDELVSRKEMEQRIAQAIELTRDSCMRDADVRVAQVREELAQDAAPHEELASLRAQLAELQTAPQHEREQFLAEEVETLRAQLEDAQVDQREEHLANLEQYLDELEATMTAEQESHRDRELEMAELQARLEARIDELEMQVHHSADAVLKLSTAKQEAEAELTAALHQQRKRISELEHDVAHRGLELVRLEKQKEQVAKEALHFSLALSAKEQEVQMLKRGTQDTPAYWKLLAQRSGPERKPLQPVSTNARRVSSEAAKRMLQDKRHAASTPNQTHSASRDYAKSTSAPSQSAPLDDLSTSTIQSVDASYRQVLAE